jgi:general secretion pathway protein C
MLVNLKSLLQKWSEKFSSLFSRLSGKRARGIMALPGQTASVSAGQFSVPLINWENVVKKSFLYNSLGLVIAAYFLADVMVLALTPYFPLAPAPRARIQTRNEADTFDRYNTILTRNLFNERGLIPNADVGDGLDGPPVRTGLPLTLLGVIVVSDPTKSVASVDDKGTNFVWAVRPGEMIGTNIQVIAIESDRMVFVNKQERRREYVELPKDQITATRRAAPVKGSSGGGITNEGNNYKIDRKEVDKVMENFNEVLTQARCVPNFEGGKSSGYRCFQIEPGSIYDKLGMKDNDVICGINGQPVNDPATAFNMLTTLKTSRNIELCINRGGQVMNMNYDIN